MANIEDLDGVMKLSLEELEQVSGGNPDDAAAYLQKMYEKYQVDNIKDLWVSMDLYEQQMYTTLFDWDH